MQAVFYDAYGPIEGLQIGDVERPRPAHHQLLVRVTRAALNPKDALFRKGKFGALSGSRFPKYCGLDFAGVIEESRSPHFQPGSRVLGMLDEWKLRRGTLAEYVVCRDVEAALLPDAVPDEAAAGAALAGSTALQALRDVGRVGAGTRVLIHGASGGVGTFAIQIARLLGAEVHTTSSERNFALCRELGASQTWDYATSALADSEPRYDVIFDVFGNLRFATVRSWVTRGVVIGTVPGPRRLARDLLTRLSRVEERLVIVRPRRADLAQIATWLAEGRLRTVIDSRFPLARVHDAFRVLESKRARGKIVIEVSPVPEKS
jgi:NADPH:quinone reductase-like Zn-dependent oxidoreductase